MVLILEPGKVTLSQLETIYWQCPAVQLASFTKSKIEAGAKRIAEIVELEKPVYGVNTGFGKLASISIAAEDVGSLQRNLILSHCCGVGKPLPVEIVHLIISLKLISLGAGASGVRYQIIQLLEDLLKHNIMPVIPEKGSVGASGDLAPLAHLAAAMLGEGEVFYQGERMPSAQALAKAGLQPVVLAAKEGLALINGTQASTAIALAGLFNSYRALCNSIISGSLTTDAIMGSRMPFHDDIHTLRGHRGQIAVATSIRKLLEGSQLQHGQQSDDKRVQDPYCIRCQPQVNGACFDLLAQAANTLVIEANAVTDNPLILSDGSVVSGGNFHAEPVAFAADQIALAICEIGAISQRRIAMLVDPNLSFGLPAFLTAHAGLHSGFMIAEVTSAALMSENKQMSHPASVDSTPTSANQEDHVSMACHGARRLLPMVENLYSIIGIEILVATQGVEFRSGLHTSPLLKNIIERVRANIDRLEEDRYMAPDLLKAKHLVSNADLITVLPEDIFMPLL